MVDLSLEQLSYMATKARLPEKLVLDTAKETVEKFMTIWDGGAFAANLGSKVVDPINDLLHRVALVRETTSRA